MTRSWALRAWVGWASPGTTVAVWGLSGKRGTITQSQKCLKGIGLGSLYPMVVTERGVLGAAPFLGTFPWVVMIPGLRRNTGSGLRIEDVLFVRRNRGGTPRCILSAVLRCMAMPKGEVTEAHPQSPILKQDGNCCKWSSCSSIRFWSYHCALWRFVRRKPAACALLGRRKTWAGAMPL